MTVTAENSNRLALVTGAAGFIGSHLVDILLDSGCTVIGVDDLSRGREDNLLQARCNPRFAFHLVDLSDEYSVTHELKARLRGRQINEVWHLAANSDIAAGVSDPRIDHRNTFLTTFNTLLLMQELEMPELIFASTSAVYGEHPGLLHETTGPLLPISTYGAMKLASEALISAAAESYLKRVHILRFPNVVGPRLTHGIIYDLLNKLAFNSREFEVLGDGTQQKPYLHVTHLVEAMLFIRDNAHKHINLFNIGPGDEGATVAEIAAAVLGAIASGATIRYTGGDRGWLGDVPRFRYAVDKLKALGWGCPLSSLEAVHRAINEVAAGRESILCR
jgi:UDP-glucose 4-epimerase